MWKYRTNCMGPYSLKWYDDNKISYSDIHIGGRIDCFNNKNFKRSEIDWPIMRAKDAQNFIFWLKTFKSKKLLTFEELKIIYESETNEELKLFKNE